MIIVQANMQEIHELVPPLNCSCRYCKSYKRHGGFEALSKWRFVCDDLRKMTTTKQEYDELHLVHYNHEVLLTQELDKLNNHIIFFGKRTQLINKINAMTL